MNASDLSALIHEASSGDIDAYLRLYRVVYKPVYKIARTALKNEEDAIEAVHQTATDSFAAIPTAKISTNASFIEWIIRILCQKIRHIYKASPDYGSAPAEKPTNIREALDGLQDIERLVLAVSSVCGCSPEKTAKLCGYTEDTVAVCLTNAEITIKANILART